MPHRLHTENLILQNHSHMNLLNKTISLNSVHTQNFCICIQKYHLNLFFYSISVLFSLFKTPRQSFGTQLIYLCLLSLILQSLLLKNEMGRSFLQSREITIIDMLGFHLEGLCTLRNKQHFFDIQITKVDPAHITEWLKSCILPLPVSILPYISSCQ